MRSRFCEFDSKTAEILTNKIIVSVSVHQVISAEHHTWTGVKTDEQVWNSFKFSQTNKTSW